MLQYHQITALISELLYKHECVIVPNFGGFVARNYPSSFSKGNNLLYPPSKQVLFNKHLIHNDGLLVSALMEKNTMLFDEACKLLEDYKNYVQSLLSVKKRFELTNIGLLYHDSEDNLRFEAKTDVNFLLDSFGFEPVVTNELFIEPEKQLFTKAFEDRKSPIETKNVKQKSYVKIATLAIVTPALVAFLLFAATSKPIKPLLQSSLNPFYTPEKIYIPNKQFHKTHFLKTVEAQHLLVDADGYAAFKITENGTVFIACANDSIMRLDNTSVARPARFVEKNKMKFDGTFQVVMGCFGVKENATKLIVKLHKSNIKAAISGLNAKGLYVVSCGGFENKEAATALLTSIKSSFPNAWVMAK